MIRKLLVLALGLMVAGVAFARNADAAQSHHTKSTHRTHRAKSSSHHAKRHTAHTRSHSGSKHTARVSHASGASRSGKATHRA
jgi:hypothetical protein